MTDLDQPTLGAQDIAALAEGRHGDPFAVLGRHVLMTDEAGLEGPTIGRAFLPGAAYVEFIDGDARLAAVETAPGLFEVELARRALYRLRIHWAGGIQETADPYSFPPVLGDLDLHLAAEGRHFSLATRLGANPRTLHEIDGTVFAVWAPNAMSVSVVGDFNGWDPRRHPMRSRVEVGIWELFVPGVAAGAVYKYAITAASGEKLPWKADPLARQAELPPRTGSVVAAAPDFTWNDEAWMADRAAREPYREPLSIYEAHIGSWLRTQHGQMGSWDEARERLIPYLVHMGFTHLELMPIMEHPFGGSWGYQPLALFAPTSRLGPPESFARFVDACHAAGIGVLLDWVPAHFPNDEHGLVRFDGTHLYEHADPREGFHRDWNTLIYNFGRHEVRGFLIASALWWLEAFHLDGLRVDAVASMLYRDYSREPGEWVPNHLGGRENLEAVSFLRELNVAVGAQCPGAMMIAEESTAWPGVTRPVDQDGLGFHFKWNMGWMHDTLRYFGHDPVHRRHHGDDIGFGLVYAFSEHYVLPLSHDEVVHGKGSLLARMPGDDWQRFANLRLLLSMMFTHPGKKLLFMGCEFGQEGEWNVDEPFPWPQPHDEKRQGLSRLVRDLNALHRDIPALHRRDSLPEGFSWLVLNDEANSVFAFRRCDGDHVHDVVVVANMTPVPRHDYRIGVPAPGFWRERLNSDSTLYAGSGIGNFGGRLSEPVGSHGQTQSVTLTLPPLALIALTRDANAGTAEATR